MTRIRPRGTQILAGQKQAEPTREWAKWNSQCSGFLYGFLLKNKKERKQKTWQFKSTTANGRRMNMFLIKRQKSSVRKCWGLCRINVCDLWINPTAQEELLHYCNLFQWNMKSVCNSWHVWNADKLTKHYLPSVECSRLQQFNKMLPQLHNSDMNLTHFISVSYVTHLREKTFK